MSEAAFAHTACSRRRIRVRAVPAHLRARARTPTTSTSWNSTARRSVTSQRSGTPAGPCGTSAGCNKDCQEAPRRRDPACSAERRLREPEEAMPRFRKLAEEAGPDSASPSVILGGAPEGLAVLQRNRDLGVTRMTLRLPAAEK